MFGPCCVYLFVGVLTELWLFVYVLVLCVCVFLDWLMLVCVNWFKSQFFCSSAWVCGWLLGRSFVCLYKSLFSVVMVVLCRLFLSVMLMIVL